MACLIEQVKRGYGAPEYRHLGVQSINLNGRARFRLTETPMPAGPVFEFGPFDSGNHQLLRGNEVIELAPKAMSIRATLVRYTGKRRQCGS